MNKQFFDIQKTARLSRLSLSAEEQARMSEEISRFAEFSDILSELEIGDGTYSENDCNGVMREDAPRENQTTLSDLTDGERIYGEYIRVPLTVEEE